MKSKALAKIIVCLSLLGAAFFALNLQSCRKDSLLTDPSKKLRFSSDTLTFDTVFTSLGSTTRYFKVVNTYSKDIEIAHIYLKAGATTKFHLNVDGVAGNDALKVRVPAHDSIYVFVSVTVDPTASNMPFIYSDDVMFDYNGVSQSVNLMAWGQNAYFHYGEVLSDAVTTWATDKPHVLVGKANIAANMYVPGVIVPAGHTLNIPGGAKIYCFNNAGIYSWGTLNINGTATDTVKFEGIRLEHYFDDLPGQWPGIAILRSPSHGSTANINYCNINESSFGVFVGSDTSGPEHFTNSSRPIVHINNSIVRNCGFGLYDAGGFKFGGINSFNSDVEVWNTLVYNTTSNAVLLVMGGKYSFYNCTVYNSGTTSAQHQDESLLISNFLKSGSLLVTNAFDSCKFVNSIIYGSLDEEISLNRYSTSPASDLVPMMDHCCVKTKLNTDSLGFTSLVKNVSPQFTDAFNGNFELSSGSPCIDAGISLPVMIDIRGHSRPLGSGFDIGAYESH